MEAIRKFSDPELVENLRTEREMEASVKAIYRNYLESLSWFITNNSGSRQDAEDIFQ